jgi:peroxiredoxin
MLINTPARDFSLPSTRGQANDMITKTLSDFPGRIVVVNFWSAECPWSERADKHLLAILNQNPDKVVILPIASNLNETSELIAEAIRQRGLDFVLLDNDCQLANSWGAQTTPHVFIVDQSGILRYQGAIDDVTFRKRSPERFYVEQAVLALLAGHLPKVQETQPYGCTIVRNI